MSLIIYETHVDIAIVCATQISQCVSSSQKSEVRISDPAVLDHTRTFLNSGNMYYVRNNMFFRQGERAQNTVQSRGKRPLWTPLGTLRSQFTGLLKTDNQRIVRAYRVFTHLQTLEPSLYLLQYTLNSLT